METAVLHRGTGRCVTHVKPTATPYDPKVTPLRRSAYLSMPTEVIWSHPHGVLGRSCLPVLMSSIVTHVTPDPVVYTNTE